MGLLIALGSALAWALPDRARARALRLAPRAFTDQRPAPSEGARLFVAYNCIDCHGPDGVGLMASSLQDGRWRYGGSEDSVYRSIADGRPEGMPQWSRMIPADHIRKLTLYVRTLDDGKDVTTMSFVSTGGTVNRPGH